MDKLAVAFGLVCGAVVIVVAASMLQMGLWYCFDDHLAMLTGVPSIGSLPPTMVWPATLFLSSVFGGRANTRANKSND